MVYFQSSMNPGSDSLIRLRRPAHVYLPYGCQCASTDYPDEGKHERPVSATNQIFRNWLMMLTTKAVK